MASENTGIGPESAFEEETVPLAFWNCRGICCAHCPHQQFVHGLVEQRSDQPRLVLSGCRWCWVVLQAQAAMDEEEIRMRLRGGTFSLQLQL